MIDLPENYPMFFNDIKVLINNYGLNARMLFSNDNEHNSLEDAKWNKRIYNLIIENKERLSK